MKQPLGVILAGGLATRMGGGDKGLLALGDRPLLAHVIDRLAPQVAGLALNANGDPARFAGFGLPVLGDSIAGFPGPLAGVLAGLDWAAGQGTECIVTAAADTPFFPRDLVARLCDAAVGQVHPLVLATTPRAGGDLKSGGRRGVDRPAASRRADRLRQGAARRHPLPERHRLLAGRPDPLLHRYPSGRDPPGGRADG